MKLTLAMFALTVLFNVQVSCIATLPGNVSIVSTNMPGGIDSGPASSISNPSVSSGLPTKTNANVPGNTSTPKNKTAATSVSNSTVGNSATGERGSGGGSDGVSLSYNMFVLTVIGANVMKVLEV